MATRLWNRKEGRKEERIQETEMTSKRSMDRGSKQRQRCSGKLNMMLDVSTLHDPT